ncbi:hypothetical protein [Ciceribacter sp. L1K22]|uniref:hypothetical protein n=1 Tax=Ciceribacter sp. L1K22 TaxID=2820275 RepID=UPI001ABE9FED|nr:hypothetical protein [Ciceribacter sp. L1K22]MBO3758971.1 hypothetical protein [Ciceribacter sp. L1K22]
MVHIEADGNARWIDVGRGERGSMEAYAGPAPSAQHILVIDEDQSATHWYTPGSTPADIALAFGVNNYVYSGSERCAPPGMPRDLDRLPDDPPPEELPPGKPPIELFPDETTLGIRPRSGLWQARLGKGRLEGCPPLMQQVFPKSAGALPSEWLEPRRLEFEAPFHPDQLEMSRRLSAEGLSRVAWRAAGEDAWQAEIFSNLFGQIPAGQGAGSKMTWRLTLKSETEIEHVATVHIVLPIEASAVLGGSENCRMVSRNHWVRVSD